MGAVSTCLEEFNRRGAEHRRPVVAVAVGLALSRQSTGRVEAWGTELPDGSPSLRVAVVTTCADSGTTNKAESTLLLITG